MGNPMQPARDALARHPRCDAYARTTGQPCKGWAMANGRCRMHGGKAGRKSTHGRYSKAAIQGRQEVRELLRALRRLIGE
jgi:hypothetical protein